MGDRIGFLQKAVNALIDFSTVIKISSVYETSPLGTVPQNNFLNMVVEIQTHLTAKDLMMHLLHVEENLGRRRDVKWGPRTIDIDILFYDRLVINEHGLIIPHARYAERKFVLEPLCEIASDLTCPIRHRSMKEIYNTLTDDCTVEKTNYRVTYLEEVHYPE
jgi:2-amino-4-hydroxy-6-hydroxymethyldihydropteridine diphosphokinase